MFLSDLQTYCQGGNQFIPRSYNTNLNWATADTACGTYSASLVSRVNKTTVSTCMSAFLARVFDTFPAAGVSLDFWTGLCGSPAQCGVFRRNNPQTAGDPIAFVEQDVTTTPATFLLCERGESVSATNAHFHTFHVVVLSVVIGTVWLECISF